jgi:hypothetical protein
MLRAAILLALALLVSSLSGEDPTPASDSRHWAFAPVRPQAVPASPSSASLNNPIDAFILAKLQEKGLSLSGSADRRSLIRRLKFDLLGLPPTQQEVTDFVNDVTPNAYEKLVDRFLASPHFGERWGRHWLDAVRFAESHGFEMNRTRPNAYFYRDFVITSLNADKPYDRFVQEQLAGDALGADVGTGFLVGGPWDEVKSPDQNLTLNQRADELHDIIGTTSSTFLGLTVACARCHAHKFDPISQLDYYRFKAVFSGVQHGERLLPNREDASRPLLAQQRRERLRAIENELLELEPLALPTAKEPRRGPVHPQHNRERFKAIEAKFVRFSILQTNQGEPCIDELEIFTPGPESRNVALASAKTKVSSSGNYPGASEIHRLEFINDGKYGNSRSWISNRDGAKWVQVELPQATTIDRVEWARDREGVFVDRLATRYRIDVSLDAVNWVVVANSEDRVSATRPEAKTAPPSLTAAQREHWEKLTSEANAIRRSLAESVKGQMAYLGKLGNFEIVHRLHRGDVMAQKEIVGPGVLSEIGPKLSIEAKSTDAQRRTALAKWITDPAHPLTARVMVNRLWQHHFGVGLVDTPSDFGVNGSRPTHPELLDYLAAQLIEHQWSLKRVHRLILTSATYRQSSAAKADALAKDAQSRLLWRYPPRRIEAEALRDAMLFVSGQLDVTMGGPGFDLFEPNANYVKVYTPKKTFGPAEFRRMVYQQKPRMQLDDTFGAFDCPDAGQIAPKRNVSTTPLQALSLLNGSFALQQADFLAQRVEREAGSDAVAQVRSAFALAFQRSPSEREQGAAVSLVRKHGLVAICRALLNTNEFIFVD